MNKTILKVHSIKKVYNKKTVVNNLSFQVKQGEIVGLLGPNGAGKTTAFYIVIGIINPDSGKIIFNDKNITKQPMHKRAKMGMGYLAQEPSIFRSLTVEKNILCVLENMPLTKKERKQRLEELLGELHLEALAKNPAYNLSGGERRRLEITRTLATNPSFLLLDEPFANIDPLAIHDVKEIIHLLAKKNISILITDHNAREIFSTVDRSYIIRNGQIMLSGTVDELIHNEDAKMHYLGNNFKL